MKDYTSNTPEFSESIKIIETSDPGHADNVNVSTIQLLQNTLSNRAILKNLLKYTYDSSRECVVNMLPFDFENGKLTIPEGMGSFSNDALVLETA